MTENLNLNDREPYLPSSSEKKQAVMMYMLVGLILSMWKREVSPYTHHHIKQSLGWFVFLVLVVFADLLLIILWILLKFFWVLAVLITIPAITIWAMGLYQARKWEYIRKSEMTNRFFLFFSGMGNRVLNLFDANHFQIIDEERYRSEDQFYTKPNKTSDQSQWTNQSWDSSLNTNNDWSSLDNTVISSENSVIQQNSENNGAENWNLLDNDQKISISNWNIWIDLSGHEINNPENQL